MPKQTFEHLPEEKKQKIAAAVKKEFLEHPYGEISLNRIVKDAGISRGSLYQYFNGKDDMLFMILREYCEYSVEMVKRYLIKNKGDIFVTISEVLTGIFDGDGGGPGRGHYAVLFSDSRIAELIVNFSGECGACVTGKYPVIAELKPYMDLTGLALHGDRETDVFLEILVDTLIRPVVYSLNDGISRYGECMEKVGLLREHFCK